MIQPEHQRRAYLEALGIDVWLPRDEVGAQAEDVAETDAHAEIPTWDDLRAAVAACTSCSLHTGRTQTVFGVGDPQADWMVIGEAPGAEEDRRGEPFVGRAGKLLDEMLRAVGQSRDRVFIANILKCRPPNNRDPKAEESAACRGYLQRQIELIEPKIILAVGRIAAQLLLETDEPVGRLRGSRHQLGDTPLVVTYHPAYLLRSPSQKRKAWDDLCLATRLMREASE
ncbi:MAG: uracil-DNA glycosylase [Gammaproteobacteria bacterium]|nr:uracil-DNA glycosylase [Gammaproteobacteria bacterium]MDH3415736.1 uracil-DNA glycosylase [Gammaproteobacteria bacterium]